MKGVLRNYEGSVAINKESGHNPDLCNYTNMNQAELIRFLL